MCIEKLDFTEKQNTHHVYTNVLFNIKTQISLTTEVVRPITFIRYSPYNNITAPLAFLQMSTLNISYIFLTLKYDGPSQSPLHTIEHPVSFSLVPFF